MTRMTTWFLALAAISTTATAVSCRGRAPGLGEPSAVIPGDDDDDGERGAGDPDFSAVIEAVNADLAANLATGAQVAVWMNDRIYIVGNFGTRDPIAGTPVTDATQFNIGSDTKKLTATAALRLVDAGTWTFDTTLADVVPALAPAHAPALPAATLHQLISHQGDGLDWVDQDTEATDDELRTTAFGAYADDAYSLAPPGTFYNYSNPNFSLTGLMLETAEQTPFADILEQQIFAPLGMTSTVARKSEVGAEGAGGTGFAPNAALGIPGGHGFDDAWETGFIRPAGGVWSTASDQMRVARFLVDGDAAVLSDALRAELTAAQAPFYPDIPGPAYGYGVMVSRGIILSDGYHEATVWHHGGNTLFHTSTFWVLPEQRFAISILSNGYGDDFTDTVVAAVESLVDLPPATDLPPHPMPDDASLAALAGDYVDDNNVGDIIVSSVDGALHVSMPGLDDAGIDYDPVLAPFSARVFLATIQGRGVAVTFWDGPGGDTYFATRAFAGVRAAGAARRAEGSTSHRRSVDADRLRVALALLPRHERALLGP